MTSQALYPLYTRGVLDPQSEITLRQFVEDEAEPICSMTPSEARRYSLASSWIGTPASGIRIEDVTIPHSTGDIPLRAYWPESTEALPVVAFFHGGGFVVGTLDEFDPLCTFLAAGVPCVVVSVDYRLAPEHKYPAAVEDAVAAVKWIAEHARAIHGDPIRIAVAGDSAGGNLATVVSIKAREYGFPKLTYQALICPWVDSSCFETASFRYFGEGLWLSAANMRWYRNHYLQDLRQAMDPFVSPLLMDDLHGLPPALVITAEFDVLRDQGEAYALRLAASGVPVQCSRYPGVLHDFAVLPGLFDRARDAITETCTALARAFKV